MLKLILCDDDAFTLQVLSDLLQEAGNRWKIDLDIKCRASNAGELFRFTENNPDVYLFFLDLDMGTRRLNGLDIGRNIREKLPDSKIVYVTSHTEQALEILKSGVEPFGFVEKNYSRELMLQELSKCLQKAARQSGKYPKQEETGKCIQIPVGIDETVSVPVERIIYVEALKNPAQNICYHTFDGSKITVRDTLKSAQTVLGNDFVLTHRSILANNNYILGTEDGQIKLANGEKYPSPSAN